MADATVVEQRIVSVFNSDDDLTNFLAGLRAKYASLYPQYIEAEHDPNDASVEDASASNAAPDAGFAGDRSAAANAVSGTASQSFEEKISQLRSSLQSLQHILPPRTSTTANLLDSFMAVSGDRRIIDMGDEPNIAVMSLTDRMLPNEEGEKEGHCVASRIADQGLAAPLHVAGLVLPDPSLTHADLLPASEPVAPTVRKHDPRCSLGSTDLMEIPTSCQALPEPFASYHLVETQEADAANACREPGAGTLSVTRPPVLGDTAPSDAAFVVLAAGYTRRTLQPPSSEASGSSFDGRLSALASVPSEPSHQAEERTGGELTLGGAFPSAGDNGTHQAWETGGQGGAQRHRAQAEAHEINNPVLGPPVAAELTWCPLGEHQQAQQPDMNSKVHLSGQQLQDSEEPGHLCRPGQSGSPAISAWRPPLGYSPGRRRAWQLVGLGGTAPGSSSPQQASLRQANALGASAGGEGSSDADVAAAKATDKSACVACTQCGGEESGGTGSDETDADHGWPGDLSVAESGQGDVPASSAAEADPASTRESSAAWDSLDDGAFASSDGVGGGMGSGAGSGRPSGQIPIVNYGVQAMDASLAQPEDSSAAAKGHRSFGNIHGLLNGGCDRLEAGQDFGLQQSGDDAGEVDEREQQQVLRGGSGCQVGPRGVSSLEPLHATSLDERAFGGLAPLLCQAPSPHAQCVQRKQHGGLLQLHTQYGDLESFVSDGHGNPAQQVPGQAHVGSAQQDDASVEHSMSEATRQLQASPDGGQRQRRRWGSPLGQAAEQLYHSVGQPLGSASAYTGFDAAPAVASPGHGNRKQWLMNESVGRVISPSGRSEDGKLSALAGPVPDLTLLSRGRESLPNMNVMGLNGPFAHDRAIENGLLAPQPMSSSAGMTVATVGNAVVRGSGDYLGTVGAEGSDSGNRGGQRLLPPHNAGLHRPLRLLPPPAMTAEAQYDCWSGSPPQDTAPVAPTPQLEQQLRQQTSVGMWLPANVAGEQGATSSAVNDEVLCGSPTEGLQQQPQEADAPDECAAAAGNLTPCTVNDDPITAFPNLEPARSVTPVNLSSEVALGSSSSGITANKGGIAFSISVTDSDAARQPLRVWSAGRPMIPADVGSRVPDAQSVQIQAKALLAVAPPAGLLGPGGIPGLADWERLNKQLREAGFSGLAMAQVYAAPKVVEGTHVVPAPAPEPASLHRCLNSVLDQYVRRNRLVAELLAATEQSGRIAEQQETAIRELKREASAARTAAEKARRELDDVSSQHMPKVEARHAVQLGRLRSENTKLKEALRVSELDLSAKTEEIRSLRSTIAGLQSASGHNSDVEGAMLRQRVAQLEGLLRNRDKEVEKFKATKEAVVGQAEDSQANALDRAYRAETTARRLEMELAAARTRIGQLEHGLRQRERDVAAMREDLQQIKACEAAATLVAQDRSAAAEDAARRTEGEAAALRGKVKELEVIVRAARNELGKQRSETDALRSSAYDEIYRLEDECRTLGAELASSRTRITQLEHVVRAKERDITRVKDEKEAAKAAERERARVAEEVSVKLEAELTAVKVRLAQAEGAVRTREREMARLAELLRQTQGAEVEAWLKQAKLEDGSRKMENDFTMLRLRILQLEAALKGRDKDCDKLARTVESLRGEYHELISKLAKSEEAARKAEADLATSRSKVLNLEGQVRVKEREQERLVRVLERLKAGDAEVASRQAALEEAARRLDGQLTAARGRVSALEGVVRARDAAVANLNKQLEIMKTADFERTAQALKSEEATRQHEAEVTAMRQRILQLEGQLRAKERELERSARQVETARAVEADAARRLADSAATVTRLENEIVAGRQRAVQLGEAMRAREREVAALTRTLEAHRVAEHETNAVAGRTEEVARKLDGEAAELRQRLIQAEGQLRTREREAERQARALEAAQTAVAEAALRQAEATATARRLEADAAGLRQRLAQTEGALRTREKELERTEKAADQAKEAEAAAEAKLRAAEGTVVQLDGELSSLRLRATQLEAAARGHAKEVERLTRAMDHSKVAQADAATRAQRSDESARQVASELASARSRLARVEASLAAREQEAQRVQRLLATAEAQAATQVLRSDEFARRVEADLATMRQRAGQLAQLIRTRDRDLTTLRGALEAARAAEAKAAEQCRQTGDAVRKVEAELAAERQRVVQLEGQVKSRDREVERLSRHLDTGRDHSNSAAVAADREASTLKDATARAEAAVATARARVTQVESELLSKERQLEDLQRLVGSSRAGDAEAAAAAEERARRAEEAARRLDAELGGVRQRYAHLEHTFRSRETTLDKLRAALAEKVAQEERRVARDKAAYQRIRAAYVATLGPAAGGAVVGKLGVGVQQQQRAAGAISAATRELRPVEIVGLYETRREAAEQELAAFRAEVRSLAEQLREAQNHIAIKDRTGAWRTPTELADMQARIILLERRSADLQRDLDRARLDAAEAARTAERRIAEVEHRAAQLKEDNEALVHELDSRPTIQDNRILKREVEILEKKLLQFKGSTAVSGAGADAEGGETALGLAMAAKGRHAGTMLTTSQRIARDRSLHRLGLRTLEDWPKDVLVDLAQDVCIELDVRDATTLPAAVRKMLRVVGAVPRMEAFIGAVCERVYVRGSPFVPPHIDGTTDPSRVIEVIEIWLELLQEGAQLRGAMRAVVEALAARSAGMATPIHGPGDVVVNVRQLVEAEAIALTARESLAAASQHMVQEPEQLLSRLVSHFMRLFDCPSLEGVVPAVNRLYVTLNEQRNFIRALTEALELPADAGASACMTRVRELVNSTASTSRLAMAAQPVGCSVYGTDLSGDGKTNSESHGLPSSASPGFGVDASAAMEQLMLLFGVRTATAAADAASNVLNRLKRLDAVLPRYQRLASQLFEALRVTSLEEIMPALQMALQS